ncbi:MAG: hypothetical protein R6W77_14245 [Trueperaceae bacterium]
MVVNPAYADELRFAVIDHPELGSVSVYDLLMTRIEQMSSVPAAFEPFTGPLQDRNGSVVVEDGQVASIEHLLGVQWAAENVEGPWEGEP